jgi:hypothetical protein
MSSNSRVSSQIQRESSQIAVQYSAQDTHAGVVVKRNFGIRWENKNAHAVLPGNFGNMNVADAFHRCGGRYLLVNRSDVNAVVYSEDDQEGERYKNENPEKVDEIHIQQARQTVPSHYRLV